MSKKLKENLNNFFSELKYINMDKEKTVSFLFGAGINANLSKSNVLWTDLAKGSLEIAFEESFSKKYSSFEIKALSNEIVNSVNNDKLVLELAENIIDLGKIIPNYKDSFFHEFKNDLIQINDVYNNYIYTLNYDLLLEETMSFDGVNLMSNLNKASTQKINHLHGQFDVSKKIVPMPRLLTMNDYITNYDLSKKLFTNLLINQKKLLNQNYLLIIGTSLKEEHILSAINDASKSENDKPKVAFFTHLPNFEWLESKIKMFYKLHNIEVFNFNFTNNIGDDFKTLWNILSDILLDKKTSYTSYFSKHALIDARKIDDKTDPIDFLKSTTYKESINKHSILLKFYNNSKIDITKLFEYIIKDNLKISETYFFPHDQIDLANINIVEFISRFNDSITYNEWDISYDENQYSLIMKLIAWCKDKNVLNGKIFEPIAEIAIGKFISSGYNNEPIWAYSNKNITLQNIVKATVFFSDPFNHPRYKNFIDFFSKKYKQDPFFKDFSSPNYKKIDIPEIKNNIGLGRWVFIIFYTPEWIKEISDNKEKIIIDLSSKNNDTYKNITIIGLYLVMGHKNMQWVKNNFKKIKGLTTYPRPLEIIGHDGDSVDPFFEIDGMDVMGQERKRAIKTKSDFIKYINKINSFKDEYEKDEYWKQAFQEMDDSFMKEINTNKELFMYVYGKMQPVMHNMFFIRDNRKFKYLCSSVREYVEMKKKIKLKYEYFTSWSLSWLNNSIPSNFVEKIKDKLERKIKVKISDLITFWEFNDENFMDNYNIVQNWYINLVDILRKNSNTDFKKIFEIKIKSLKLSKQQKNFLLTGKTYSPSDLTDLILLTFYTKKDKLKYDFNELLKGENSSLEIYFSRFIKREFWKKVENLDNPIIVVNKWFKTIKSFKNEKWKRELDFIKRIKTYYVVNYILNKKLDTNYNIKKIVEIISFRGLLWEINNYYNDDSNKDALNDEKMAEIFFRLVNIKNIKYLWILKDKAFLGEKAKNSLIESLKMYLDSENDVDFYKTKVAEAMKFLKITL